MRDNKKIPNQNIFDYLITYYGNLNNIYSFVKENNIESILDFGKASISTRFDTSTTSNPSLTVFDKYNITVATGVNPPIGDFNNDYNNDHFTS